MSIRMPVSATAVFLAALIQEYQHVPGIIKDTRLEEITSKQNWITSFDTCNRYMYTEPVLESDR